MPRVVFMGSPDFAVPSLEALAREGYDVALVVTQPDRPAGRGGRVLAPAVRQVAERLGVPVVQPETLKDETVQATLRGTGADIFVVAAYGKILPRAVLSIPRLGCINVHGSLLPRWRGASPIAAAILAGDAETGVSIMEMAVKMDAGPVIARATVALGPDATAGALEVELSIAGAEALVDTLPRWISGELKAEPQDEAAVTYCRTMAKVDGHLGSEMTARQAERAVRAYDPWPGAYVEYRGERLAVWRAHVEPASGATPGQAVISGKVPAIAFYEGLLMLDEVQRPGSRRTTGMQYLNGIRGDWGGMVMLR
ncbi:MAG: methionyl-tRNA formyltransferase [Dehalococcoidia bacterium]